MPSSVPHHRRRLVTAFACTLASASAVMIATLGIPRASAQPATTQPGGPAATAASGEQRITTPSGLIIIERGRTDEAAKPGDRVSVHYTGTLQDGTVFDSSRRRNQPFSFVLGGRQVIAGWDEGVAGMRVGQKSTLIIPPSLAYGERGMPPTIPANSTLTFEVEVVGIEPGQPPR